MAKKTLSTERLGLLEKNPTSLFISAADEKDAEELADAIEKGRTLSEATGRFPSKGFAPSGKKRLRAPVPPGEDPELRLYSLSELEGILGVSTRSLSVYVKDGRLKARKIGTRWMVSRRNLIAFLNADD